MSDHARRDTCNGILEALKEFGQHDDEAYVFLALSESGIHSGINGRVIDLISMVAAQMVQEPQLREIFEAAIEVLDSDDEDIRAQIEKIRRLR